jgi:cytoskeletal protein CcmA (bactofilin family)
MAAPVLQFKRGLLANLPALRAGEPGFTTDSYDLYVGLTSETNTNKFFGSHRYWTKETTSTGSGINLVEGTSNGSDFITLAAPALVGAALTYYFPAVQGSASSVLTNDGSGNLTWASGSANPVFTGIATFTDTTDNTLGDADTGAVQIDGGLGINKNTTVGANLNVQGYSEFVGVSTFGGNLDINASVDISTDLIVNQNLSVTGVSTFTGLVDANGGADISGQATLNNDLSVTGVSTFTGLIDSNGGLDVSGQSTLNNDLSVTGVSTFTGLIDSNGGLDVLGHSELDNVNVSGIITASSVVFGSGTAITSVDTDLSTVSASDDTLASAKAIKDYVDSQVTAQDLDFADGIGGTGAVDLDSQSLTIAGTANEIETSASGQTLTIGLPNDVVVGTSLSSPTVKVATLQHSNGTQAATIDSSGNITASQNLTITGDLFVNGSTTQVNTSSLTVEDRTIELGIVNGSAPSSTTTWDLGVLFNYYQSSAKKSAVIWEQSVSRFVFGAEVSDGGGTDNDSPQITFSSYAPIEISALWVNDCAGQSQVISCTGSERFLENITVDAGTF